MEKGWENSVQIEQVNLQKINEWEECLPNEVSELVQQKRNSEGNNIRIIGIRFLEETAGTLCWGRQGTTAVLYSIYIQASVRRLGLGHTLVEHWLEETRQAGCVRWTVSYTEGRGQEMLMPFLTTCGYELEETAFPEGIVTLEAVNNGLLKGLRENVNKYTSRTLPELPAGELQICGKWLEEQMQLPIELYLGERPASFVSMVDHQLQGILLFREQSAELWLDYCWIRQGDSVTLVRLFITAMQHLNAVYTPDTKIHMLLSSAQAMQLYHHLFGQPQKECIFITGEQMAAIEESETI